MKALIESWIDQGSEKFADWMRHKLDSEIKDGQREARAAGHADGYQAGLEAGKEIGRGSGLAEGRQLGLNDGYSQGWTDGYQEGQLNYTITDDRSDFIPRSIDTSLYGPKPLSVTSEMKGAMRRQTTQAVDARIVGEPTPEQWEMILTDHPAACVSAGAGSGKSTTLVLRVVFMVEYMKIPLDNITIVSFTRASCADLRRKLAKAFGFWQGRIIDADEFKYVVSTYHALLLRLTCDGFPKASIFEFLDDKGDFFSIEQWAEEDIDNPALNSKLGDKQLSLLQDVYRQVYSQSDDFRAHINALLVEEFNIRRHVEKKTYKDGAYALASQRDPIIVDAMRALWVQWGLAEYGLHIEATVAFRKNGHPFLADGRVGPDGPLFLLDLPAGVDGSQLIEVPSQRDPMKLSGALAMRKRIFVTNCEEPIFILRKPEQLKRLKLICESIGTNASTAAPLFTMQLPGEFKESLLVEALFQQGSFISSLGRDVPALLAKIPAPRDNHAYEHHFISALGIYWQHLERHLYNQKILSFNQLFQMATQNARSLHIRDQRLDQVRHLLVDEFQDISPLIADWLTAMQRKVLGENPNASPSIMAIGDDWQSIYGWRGSSPELFVGFPKYFRSHPNSPKHKPIRLTVNFRSIPEIVRDAAVLIDKVSVKDLKDCRSGGQSRPGDHGVRVHEYREFAPDVDVNDAKQVANAVKPFILGQIRDAKVFENASDDHVIVMARSNTLSKALRDVLPITPGLEVCTYHKAKGLEADIAIMVGDCSNGEYHPFRNMVYTASERFPSSYTYEQAKADEAYRLAYVGVTRGRRRTHWVIPEHASSFAASAYDKIKA